MRIKTFAASCALLCTLHVPNLALRSTTFQAGPELTAIVIRYDPEAIFLTHELISPLTSREVRLIDEATEQPLGELVLVSMISNGSQPHGVFVGYARVKWAAGVELSEEERDAVLDSGLQQLRSALADRLVRPRRDHFQRRISVLEAMESTQREAADAKAQEIARRDRLAAAKRALDETRVTQRARSLEQSAAQQELLVATAKVQEADSMLQAARAKVEKMRADIERARVLVAQGIKSELDLQSLEARLLAATSELDIFNTQLDSQQMQVSQRRHQVDAAERAMADVMAKAAQLQKEVASLAREEQADTDATLQIGRATDQGRLTELGVELQRARAALATITDVTIERW